MNELSRLVESISGIELSPTEITIFLSIAAVGLIVIVRRFGSNSSELAKARSVNLTSDRNIQQQTYQSALSEIDEEILPALQKQTGAIVLELVHDTDFDEYFREEAPHHISFDQAFEIIRRIKAADKSQPIYLILHTLGGYSLPSIMIADTVKKHRQKGGQVLAFVPYIAMSGGTVAALTCDFVWMSDIARLGPIDTMYGGTSGQALQDMSKHKPTEKLDDGTVLDRIEAVKFDTFYQDELKLLIDFEGLDSRIHDGTLSHSNLFNRETAREYGVKILPNKSYKPLKPKELAARTKLITRLVDARLRMIKNHHEKKASTKE
jgi:ATP-dependent protease ClpP protease subunit